MRPRSGRDRSPPRAEFIGCGGSKGFTLLEILLALAILAFGLTAVFQSFQSGTEQARLAEAATLRVLEARSIIDAAVASVGAAEGSRSGKMPDGSKWRLDVTPIADREMHPRSIRTYAVTLTVSDGDRVLLTLKTYAATR